MILFSYFEIHVCMMFHKKFEIFIACLLGFTISTAQNINQVTIVNESTINSSDLEFSPAFYEDGIVFISTRDAGPKLGMKDIRANMNNFSVFWAQRDINGILKTPLPFSDDINTRFNEGPLTFSRTQDEVYFCRTVIANGKEVKSSNGVSRMNIYMAEKKGSDWVGAMEMPFNDINYDFVHPAISVTGDKMYLSSNKPGGYGGMDLYVSIRKGSTWGEPVNLGPKINTSGHETFPYIHPDGTLFFASDGRDGLGGLDIFFVPMEGSDPTGLPKALDAPVNSSADDFGFIVDVDKKNGYFSSNRNEGKGEDDIYSFHTSGRIGEPEVEAPMLVDASLFVADKLTGGEIAGVKVVYYEMDELANTEIITDAEGNVTKIGGEDGELVLSNVDGNMAISAKDGSIAMKLKKTRYLFILTSDGLQTRQVVRTISDDNKEFLILMEPVGSTIALKGLVMNEIYKAPLPGATISIVDGNTQATEILTSDLNGRFEYSIQCNVPYTVSVTKGGYNSVAKQINITDCTLTEQVETFDLYGFSNTLAEGSIIRLPNIYYNYNDAGIRPDAQRDLNALAALLQQYGDIRIELMSHTDSRGEEAYNVDLSQRRAANAKDYLVEKGVDMSRIIPKGYGEKKLKNECKDNIPCDELAHQRNRRTEVKILKSPTGYQVEYLNNQPEVVSTREDYLRYLKETEGKVSEASGNTEVTEAGKEEIQLSGKTFLVVAGTFKNVENAAAQLSKVLDAGYADAIILDYPDNKLHGVVVKTFNDFYAAKEFADEVQAKTKLDTFVKPYNQ